MTIASTNRTATVRRATNETTIDITLDLDGQGRADIATGLPFLDHMLTALSLHARLDLSLRATGDLEVDDHHTVEDCALALGQAIDQALGERRGIARFASAYAPLDEALTRTVIDLSGRPWPAIRLQLTREMIGTVATESLTHFFQSLAIAARMSLHVTVLEGDNDHHKVEAAFKATALALRSAVRRDDAALPATSPATMPSTKGVL